MLDVLKSKYGLILLTLELGQLVEYYTTNDCALEASSAHLSNFNKQNSQSK